MVRRLYSRASRATRHLGGGTGDLRGHTQEDVKACPRKLATQKVPLVIPSLAPFIVFGVGVCVVKAYRRFRKQRASGKS